MGYEVKKMCNECLRKVRCECIVKGDFIILIGEESWARFKNGVLLCPECAKKARL